MAVLVYVVASPISRLFRSSPLTGKLNTEVLVFTYIKRLSLGQDLGRDKLGRRQGNFALLYLLPHI